MRLPDYKERPLYVNKISPYIGKQIIKVITGQRRVGKSYILFNLIDFIKDKDPQANIIYINCELEQFLQIKSHEDLLKYVKQQLKPGVNNYLLIDEIQEISSFE
ncbi:MAG: AAA family ATPase, partial [Tenuifilaceae bacterium]